MKVIISGYGKMGHMVERELARRGIELVKWTEDVTSEDPALCKECVCIDFTFPESFRANYPFIAASFKAAVIGTTGWDDIREEVIAEFEKNDTPAVYASNFSIGVNAFFAAAQKACQVLGDQGYAPVVEEVHHIHKLDAPSGTAVTLASLVEGALGQRPDITSVRRGEVPGIHTLTLSSGCDKLTFRHEAFSREGFARGAVQAAVMTEGLQGVHEFKDIIL